MIASDYEYFRPIEDDQPQECPYCDELGDHICDEEDCVE